MYLLSLLTFSGWLSLLNWHTEMDFELIDNNKVQYFAADKWEMELKHLSQLSN